MLTLLLAAAAPAQQPVAIHGSGPAEMPTFKAQNPQDAAIARIAWEAGVECTGRQGQAHRVIELQRRTIADGYLGFAYWDEQGVHRIDIDPKPGRMEEVIVHEIAHAWVHKGPTTLVEGRTELLADCMVRKRTGLAALQWDDGSDLGNLPDLRDWDNHKDHGPARIADARTDAYLGAARLVRTAAMLVDERLLWASNEMDFAGFADIVREAEGGALLLAAVDGGADTQRRALSDSDLDGLPAVAEQIKGTNPHAWDSDRNGWWDGAILGVPSTAVAVPFDGSPVCTSLSSPAGAPAQAASGGNLRGQGQPRVNVRQTRDGGPLMVELRGTTHAVTGGLWAVIEGQHLDRQDRLCIDTESATAWVADPAFAHHLPAFMANLLDAAARADQRWGRTTRRMGIALGAKTTHIDGQVVELSSADVQAALEHDTLEHLATLAVALHRVWDNGTREWPVAAAMARSLTAELEAPTAPGAQTEGPN
jgi:hypothetical protein